MGIGTTVEQHVFSSIGDSEEYLTQKEKTIL